MSDNAERCTATVSGHAQKRRPNLNLSINLLCLDHLDIPRDSLSDT